MIPRTSQQWLQFLLVIFFLLLPWQVRYILVESIHPLTVISLYSFDILLVLVIAVWIWYWYHHNHSINWSWVLLSLSGVLVVWLSGYWATDREVALSTYLRFAGGVGLIGIMATVPLRLRWIGYCLLINGLIQTGFAWTQSLWQMVVAQKWIGVAAQLPETAGTSVLITTTGRWLRAYGTLPHPNITGGVLVLALLATAMLWSTTQRRWEKYCILVSALLITSGLLLTFSRSAILVWLLLALAGIWLLQESRTILITSVITLAALAVPFYPLWSARLDLTTYTEHYSLTERSNQFHQAMGLWKRHWPMGIGIGQYTLQFGDQADTEPIHMVPWLIAIEIGIVATALWYWLVIQTLWQTHWRVAANRQTALCLIAILILGLFDHYFWTTPSMFWLWCGLLGLHLQISKNILKSSPKSI